MGKVIKLKRKQPPSLPTLEVSDNDLDNLNIHLPPTYTISHLALAKSLYNSRSQDGTNHWTDEVTVYLNVPPSFKTMKHILEQPNQILLVPLGLLRDLYEVSHANINIVLAHPSEGKYLLHTNVDRVVAEIMMFDKYESIDPQECLVSVIEFLLKEEIEKMLNSRVILTANLLHAFASESHPFHADHFNDLISKKEMQEFARTCTMPDIYSWAYNAVDGFDLFVDFEAFDLHVASMIHNNRKKCLYDEAYIFMRDAIMRTE
jgi:hypothetical protein